MTRLAFPMALLLLVAGCVATAPGLMEPPAGRGMRPEYQTRLYETADEGRVLLACATLLQTMGFQVDEAASALGVLSASKTRDANRLTPGEQTAVNVVSLGLLLGGYTAPLALFLMPAATPQPRNIAVGITTRKVGQGGSRVSVGVVFKENSAEIADPAIYREFFEQLSKALFLEVHDS